jgi:SAM-dependent methyltransferase
MPSFELEDDQIESILCPICKGKPILSELKLLKCQTCTHLFNDNIHDDDYWNNLYDNAYTQDERKSNEQRNLMYQHDIHWISKVRPLKGNFLDVGCSFGNFFSFMPSNVKKIGIDISTNVINDAKKKHPNCEFYKSKICEFKSNEKFDFIQFRGVIQHTNTPYQDLECAVSLLKKNGVIIIESLPDFSSITFKFFKDKFRFYTPKTCPNCFTDSSFHHLLELLNLKIISQTSPYFGTPYERFPLDLISFFTNRLTNKFSPPFYGVIKNYMITKI